MTLRYLGIISKTSCHPEGTFFVTEGPLISNVEILR